VLTITPNGGLPYKDASLPDEDADVFTFQLNTGARDQQGEELAETFEASFSTLKRVTHKLPLDAANSSFAIYTDKSR